MTILIEFIRPILNQIAAQPAALTHDDQSHKRGNHAQLTDLQPMSHDLQPDPLQWQEH
jgi:hypothetical protein